MQATVVLTPAYGKDYKSRNEAVEAYKSGKDWILHDPTSRWNGRYCSCRDFVGQTVELRYNKKQDVVLVNHNPKEETK